MVVATKSVIDTSRLEGPFIECERSFRHPPEPDCSPPLPTQSPPAADPAHLPLSEGAGCREEEEEVVEGDLLVEDDSGEGWEFEGESHD